MHQWILKQTTETESSNFNANGAAGFAQLIRINEVDVMSVLTVSKTRKISLWLLMKMRTSLHGINKKVSMARALQLAGASLFLELHTQMTVSTKGLGSQFPISLLRIHFERV